MRKPENSLIERQQSSISGNNTSLAKDDNISSEQRFIKLMKFDIDIEFDKINKMIGKHKLNITHNQYQQ